MPGTQPIDESTSDALEQARRFLMALADRDARSASTELSTDATYHVPGSSPEAGTFAGPQEIVTYFQRFFDFTGPTRLSGEIGFGFSAVMDAWAR